MIYLSILILVYSLVLPQLHATYGPLINLSNDGIALTEVAEPNITAQQSVTTGRNIYVVWSEFLQGGTSSDIFFKRHIDGGNVFGSTIRLSYNSGYSVDPQIAVSGNNVYIAWLDSTTGTGDIYFTRSTDNGATFGDVINVSHNSELSQFPQIITRDNNVYITWVDMTGNQNGDIFFARSTNNGLTFEEPKNVSHDEAASSLPRIAMVENNLYIVWNDNSNGNWEVYLRMSRDKGVTFGDVCPPDTVCLPQALEPLNLSANSGDSTAFRLVPGPGKLYVVWEDTSSGNRDIYLRTIYATSGNVSPTINISNDQSQSTNPELAVVGRNVYLVWVSTLNQISSIVTVHSIDSGISFGNAITLNRGNEKASAPQVFAEGTNVHATWTSHRDSLHSDIATASSSNEGYNFGEPENLSTDDHIIVQGSRIDKVASFDPRIIGSPANVYIVWVDRMEQLSSGSLYSEIFFKRGI